MSTAIPRKRGLEQTYALALKAALALLFTLLTGLGAHVAIPLPPFGVPQTLQTLMVVLAALCLGPRWGAASMAFYIVMGMVGVPLFAEGEAGLLVLIGQTGGYLIGFMICQPVIHRCVRDSNGRIRSLRWLSIGVLLGHLVIFTFGVPWLWAVRNLDPATDPITVSAALYGGMVVFLPAMVLKCALAVLIGWFVLRR